MPLKTPGANTANLAEMLQTLKLEMQVKPAREYSGLSKRLWRQKIRTVGNPIVLEKYMFIHILRRDTSPTLEELKPTASTPNRRAKPAKT